MAILTGSLADNSFIWICKLELVLSVICIQPQLSIICFYNQDGHWSTWHYIFTAFSPLPMSLLLLLTTKGWKGFTLAIGVMPLPALLVLVGKL